MVINDIGKVVGRETITLDQDLFIQRLIVDGDVTEYFIIKRRCTGFRNRLTNDKLLAIGNACFSLFNRQLLDRKSVV